MLFRNRVPVAQEDAARPVHSRIGGVRLDLPQDLRAQRLIVARGFLVEDDQVRTEAAQSPVSVREQHFPHQREIAARRTT